MDVFVMISIVVSFAGWVTAHVALCASLAARDPWWHGAVALVVPPLAPVFGFRERLRARSFLWATAGVAYVVARVAAETIAR